jgi:RNA polymerase sigma-70 factor (ECF subfamily)
MTIPDGHREALAPMSPDVVRVLVDNHVRFLGFLERRVGSREAAEDILQQAYVRGLERGGALREHESAVAWFYRLLRNAVVDHHRRRGAERRAIERVAARVADDTAPPADDEFRNEVCRCVDELLATLRPEYAEALRRVDLEGGEVRDYAAAAGITANNASVRLHRARRAMGARIAESCGTCATHGCLDCSCGGPSGTRDPQR